MWSFLVKRRAGFKCEVCGRPGEITLSGQFAGKNTKGLEAHHLISKGGNNYLRHNLDNGISLCYRCHKANNNIVAHGAMEAVHNFLNFFEQNFPKRWEKYKENKDKKFTDKINYLEKLQELELIKEMNGEKNAE